jgi:dTDP-4-dehydrorhamnose 3,5-epimerase
MASQMAEFQIRDQPLPGVFVLDYPQISDLRGDFSKFFHADALRGLGIAFSPAESFLTRSNAGVLRGMHFQMGEAAHDKIVVCIKGRVLDVVVDIRPDSPYFNQPFALELSQVNNAALLIGKGYAHGFFTLTDDSWLLYLTTTVHSPAMDRGVLWSSIAMDWPCQNPLLSDRDMCHPSIHSGAEN